MYKDLPAGRQVLDPARAQAYVENVLKNEKIFQVTQSSNETPTLLKEKLMESVTEIFKQKAIKENAFKLNPPSYSDPSI